MNEPMPHARSNPKNLYVDRDIQGAVVRRILFYWFACLLFLTIPVVIANPELFFFEHLGGI